MQSTLEQIAGDLSRLSPQAFWRGEEGGRSPVLFAECIEIRASDAKFPRGLLPQLENHKSRYIDRLTESLAKTTSQLFKVSPRLAILFSLHVCTAILTSQDLLTSCGIIRLMMHLPMSFAADDVCRAVAAPLRCTRPCIISTHIGLHLTADGCRVVD